MTDNDISTDGTSTDGTSTQLVADTVADTNEPTANGPAQAPVSAVTTETAAPSTNGKEPVVTLKQLLEAGVHFGHQTRRWNPRMQRFIHGEISGIYIVDLKKTMKGIEAAYTFVRDTVAEGGSIMFVGTKKQVQSNIRSYAERCGMPYVNQRWLGGTLTNFATIHKRVEKMREYQRMKGANELAEMPKKDALRIQRELDKLERNLTGIGKIVEIPDAIFVFDVRKEQIAVTEANKLNIPIIAVVDTNCDPDVIQYIIPGNDDAIRSGDLMCRIICDAVIEGRQIAATMGVVPKAAAVIQRSPEEETEFQQAQAKARDEAAAAAAERESRLRSKPADVAELADVAEPDEVAEPADVAELAAATEPADAAEPADSPDSPDSPETADTGVSAWMDSEDPNPQETPKEAEND